MVATTETALDWYRRSQRQRAAAQIPTDPSSAASAFVRGASGFAPLDAAWRTPSSSSSLSSFHPATQHVQHSANHGYVHNYPVVILEGSIGKTWSLLSLAARFVVVTRASRFDKNDANEDVNEDVNEDQVMEEAETPTSPTSTKTSNNNSKSSSSSSSQQPQVILLDSNWDLTISKLAYMVRSTLLREPSFHAVTEETLEGHVEGCLRRIHLATVDEVQDAWVPILECLRCKLKDDTTTTNQQHPTLLLWDGFYTNNNNNNNDDDDASKQPEIRRQVLRLLHDCSITMVATGRGSSHHLDWLRDNHKRDLHRVQLEKQHPQKMGGSSNKEDCYAIVNGTKMPFSISLGGVLS
ncbi:unnamed protein product [Cylindrotheca closterium]|uniref:Uncharacterized protein n=1 Tax=Cylindrotheca closterium TaxID=2856 RepID=A0AAD2CQU3_9STRA|nr:unnamed protein product [Cylindrotheca closterium]